MKKETETSNDTIQKLKSLLGTFGSGNSNIDMYSLNIRKKLKEKLKHC